MVTGFRFSTACKIGGRAGSRTRVLCTTARDLDMLNLVRSFLFQSNLGVLDCSFTLHQLAVDVPAYLASIGSGTANGLGR